MKQAEDMTQVAEGRWLHSRKSFVVMLPCQKRAMTTSKPPWLGAIVTLVLVSIASEPQLRSASKQQKQSDFQLCIADPVIRS